MKYKKKETKNFVDAQTNIYPEMYNLGKDIKSITFQVTENCCLACTYCYQTKKTNNKMTFDTAKQFIDLLLTDYFEQCNSINTFGIMVDFIGGEPFLEIDLIEQIWEYLLLQLIKRNHPWQYHLRGNLCSNGILYFSPKVQNFFKKYASMFSFTISIDGNKQLHDTCRVDFQGNGSYDRAMLAVKHYAKTFNFNIMPPTKMTLSPENIYFTYDAVINLIEEGYEEIFLNCVFEEGWQLSHAQILYQEMIKIADYIIDNNLNDKIYISLFDEDLFCPMSETDNENWCGGVGSKMLSLNYKGEFFPCIRYMESSLNGAQKPLKIGDLTNGYLKLEEDLKNYNLTQNITRRSQSTDECFYCPIAKGCAWCSGYNYQRFGTPNKRATYICNMHKARALANIYYWNKLYQKLNIDKVFKNYLSNEDIQKIKL